MELTSINRKVRCKAERTARCSSGQETEAQERTAFPATNGFLKHRFTPVMADMPEQLQEREKVERDFFNSLSNLKNLYDFEIEAPSDLAYPFNIASLWTEVTYHMGIKAPKTGMAILQSATTATTIVTFEGYNTGNYLYYIPLRPLWKMANDSEKKPLTALLLSLYAYLYQIIGVPDYTKDDYSLYHTYQSLKEWYETDCDMEKEYVRQLKAALRLAKSGGKSVVSKISRKGHLLAFGKRLQGFFPKDDIEKGLKAIAQDFYNLSIQYPNKSFGASIYIGLEEPEEEQRIWPDEYLSFIWDNDDILIDDFMENMNNQLNEKSVMDEPLALQYFDSRQDKICHDLSFEAALFPLLDKLIYHLNNL